jgi:hypothetical protein
MASIQDCVRASVDRASTPPSHTVYSWDRAGETAPSHSVYVLNKD